MFERARKPCDWISNSLFQKLTYIQTKGKTMNTIIAAISANKLAGLQIDLLQKMRQNQITSAHLEHFLGLTKTERDIFVLGNKPEVAPSEKFALFTDLGTITVPECYVHGKRLDSFSKENHGKFYRYNTDITDANFPNPSRVLKPGDKLHVRVFKQTISSATTIEERMAFLATQKAIYVGAQGASLVWEQKRDKLPKGYLYAFYDEKDRLWEQYHDYLKVSYMEASRDGSFNFNLSDVMNVCGIDHAFLCFSD